MKITFTHEGISDVHYQSTLSEVEKVKVAPDGREYKLIGISEKNYKLVRRIWLGVRACTKILFGASSEKVKDDWNTCLTGKRKIVIYHLSPPPSSKPNLDVPSEMSSVSSNPINNLPLEEPLSEEKPIHPLPLSQQPTANQSPIDIDNQPSISPKLIENKSLPAKKLVTYLNGQVPSLSELALKVLLEKPAINPIIPPSVDQADKFLKIALNKNMLTFSASLTLFQQAEELDLRQVSFPFSRPLLNSLLRQMPRLRLMPRSKIIMSYPQETKFSSKDQQGETFTQFETFRYLLTNHPLQLSFRDVNPQTLRSFLEFLNPIESFNLFQIFSKNSTEDTCAWLTQGLKESNSYSENGQKIQGNLAFIFNGMNEEELPAYCSLILNEPRKFETGKWLASLPLDCFESLVNKLKSHELILILAVLRRADYFSDKNIQKKIQDTVIKSLELNPHDGKLFYQLFYDTHTKETSLSILSKNSVQWNLLTEQINLSAQQIKLLPDVERFDKFRGLLSKLQDVSFMKFLPLIEGILTTDLEAFALYLNKTEGTSEYNNNLRIGLCLQQTLKILDDKSLTLEEQKKKFIAILKQMSSLTHGNGRYGGDQEIYAFNLFVMCEANNPSLIMNCFVKANKRSHALVTAWMKKVLEQENLALIQTSFSHFWTDYNAFSWYEPGSLALILPSINTKEKLEMALVTFPDSLPLEEKKKYIQQLVTGKSYYEFGSLHTYSIHVKKEEITEVAKKQTGENRAILELLGFFPENLIDSDSDSEYSADWDWDVNK